MDINQEHTDKLNAVLSIRVGPQDYGQRVDDVLNDYRRKARVDGFRPGKVPMGLIRKMYRVPVLVDEVNKLVSESIFTYLQENNVKILGEPLPHREEGKKVDFENEEEFEFKFDLGLAPALEMDISAREKIPFYTIKVEKQQVDEYIESLLQRHGEFTKVEKAGDRELIKGTLIKADKEGNEVENGIRVEGISMSLEAMKDEEQKLLFSGTGSGDEVVFDVKKAYPSDAEVASLLRIERSQAAMLEGTFKCMIDEVLEFRKGEMGKELWDRVYGEGKVNSEKEFTERVKEEIALNYKRESEYRFLVDTRQVLIKKAKLDLPVEFLKRWMVETNEQTSEEQVEGEFEKYEDEFRWQLVKEHLIKKHEIKVTQEEALEKAKGQALNQYLQYGISNVPDDYLENYAKELMSKPEESRRFYDQKAEEKLVAYVKSVVKVEEKEVNFEKFRKLYEK